MFSRKFLKRVQFGLYITIYFSGCCGLTALLYKGGIPEGVIVVTAIGLGASFLSFVVSVKNCLLPPE